MKRTPLKRKTQLKARTAFKRAKRPLGASKTPKTRKSTKTINKGFKIPKWYKQLPYYSSDHGRGAVQKRAWRVISQTYREQDWILHGPLCPCCGKYLSHWKEGQLGHWLRYSLCNGFFKYDRINMAMICAGCNYKDDAVTLKRLGETLQKRFGFNVLTLIEQENQSYRGQKMEDWAIVDYIARLRPDLVVK
jgi:hypothetical protein